jgi:hypothetical protein
LIDEFKVAFPARTPVLFNPNLAFASRTCRIRRFGEWWNALHATVLCAPQCGNPNSNTWLSHPASEDDKEALVVRFLNQLFEFANKGVAQHCCSQIFSAWPGTAPISETGDLGVLLSELWATLMRMQKTRLADMVDVADRIAEGEIQ